MTGTIYLIHFDKPFKHARHYIGWSANLEQRIGDHGSARGSRLVQIVTAAGITWRVVRTWEGSRKKERKLKNMKCSPRLCPVCVMENKDRISLSNKERLFNEQ